MRDPVDSVCYLPPSNFRDFCESWEKKFPLRGIQKIYKFTNVSHKYYDSERGQK